MLKQLSPIGALFALFEGREIPLPFTGCCATGTNLPHYPQLDQVILVKSPNYLIKRLIKLFSLRQPIRKIPCNYADGFSL